MQMNVQGNPVHDLMREWVFEGENEKETAIKELLENRPDHVRAMIKLQIAQMKITCAHAVQNKMKLYDDAHRPINRL